MILLHVPNRSWRLRARRRSLDSPHENQPSGGTKSRAQRRQIARYEILQPSGEHQKVGGPVLATMGCTPRSTTRGMNRLKGTVAASLQPAIFRPPTFWRSPRPPTGDDDQEPLHNTMPRLMRAYHSAPLPEVLQSCNTSATRPAFQVCTRTPAPRSVLSFKPLPPEAEPFKFAPEPGRRGW